MFPLRIALPDQMQSKHSDELLPNEFRHYYVENVVRPNPPQSRLRQAFVTHPKIMVANMANPTQDTTDAPCRTDSSTIRHEIIAANAALL